jgi:hypothetical protein
MLCFYAGRAASDSNPVVELPSTLVTQFYSGLGFPGSVICYFQLRLNFFGSAAWQALILLGPACV